MDKLLNVLIIVTFVTTFVDYIIPLLGVRFDRKPFNCAFCLSFWMSLFLAIVTGQLYYLVTPLFLRVIERRLL